MTPLVKVSLLLRRGLRAGLAVSVAIGLAALVVYDAAQPMSAVRAGALGVILAALIGRSIARRVRAVDATYVKEAELGCLVIIGAFFLVIRADRSFGGDAYPAVFVCLSVVSAFARPAAALTSLALAVALELLIRRVALPGSAPAVSFTNIGFMVVFTGLNAAVLRTEVARLRSVSGAELKGELDKIRDDARSYRLLGAPAAEPAAAARPASGEDEERLTRSGVEEIHQSVLFALRLVRETMGLHTAMLLWQNDAGTHLRISELVTDAPDLVDGPFLTGDGIFGAAHAQGSPVSLSDLKPTYKLPYYAGPCPVNAVVAVPVFEHGTLRGIFVADRIGDRPFTAREESMLEEASKYAVRAIHNERVFLQLERAKVEQGKLYRSAEALGRAKTEPEVIDAGVKSAREITSVDYAALTLYDEKTRTHEISATSSDFAQGTDIAGTRFRSNTGLVSMALENRHPLPYRGAYDARKQVVFTRHVVPPTMPSILVLPLVAHERPLGTLVLGSRKRGAFGEAVRGTLEVLSSHMAVSLEGARMVKRLEDLATTDGLTGLLNKRAMLEMAEAKITAAKRFGRNLAVLVTDIDHFKKVNDTYGHDVGDVVIKGLGDILRRAKRNTDAVARFGGEEFVVICEETDQAGALLLAERVREELGKTTFVAGEGVQFRVTCSIGVATFPAAGSTWDALFKAADTALYASKQGGRNRTTVHSGKASATHAA
ncbi:MAG: sensor domain-containing diguanylate cyclase [Polyangiaceae bacterium]